MKTLGHLRQRPCKLSMQRAQSQFPHRHSRSWAGVSSSMLPACSRVGQGDLGHILHGKWTGGSEILFQPPCYPQAVSSGCMNANVIPVCALHRS